MSSAINLTNSIRNSLGALNLIQSNIDTVSNKLSTGLEINSATDDPVRFFAAKNLNSRADGLDDLQIGVKNSLSVLKAADEGLNAIDADFKSLQSILQQADAAAVGYDTKAKATVTGTTGGTNANALQEDIGNAGTSGLRSAVFTFFTDTGFKAQISIGSSPVGFSTGTAGTSGAGTVKTITELNQALADAGVHFSASLDGVAQVITFTSTDTGASQSVAGQSSAAALGSNFLSVSSAGASTAVTVSAPVANLESQNIRNSLASQWAQVMKQIDSTAAQANVNGVNPLTGGTVVAHFDADPKAVLTQAGIDATSAGFGIKTLKIGSTNGASTLVGGSVGDLADSTRVALTKSLLDKSQANLHAAQASFATVVGLTQARLDFMGKLNTVLRNSANDNVAADKGFLAVQNQALLAAQSFATNSVSSASRNDIQAALQLIQGR